MGMIEIIPLWLVNLLSFTTVFSVMTSIGTTITLAASLHHLRSPALLIRGLLNILVLVPTFGIAASIALDLDLAEKLGVTLIVIAPGAPLALRRALGSGAHADFSPTLQIAVAILAVPVLPLWVAISNAVLGTNGVADPGSVARQVFFAQLLPLALGTIVKRWAPEKGAWIGKVLGRAGAILLIGALISIAADLHYSVLAVHRWPLLVAVLTTVLALFSGHFIGGPLPEVRHSIAIAGSMRNVGLALWIATINQAPATVQVVIISYGITAILVVTVYIRWWAPTNAAISTV
jgi:BASS family bile acid:Na+ symporter